MTDRPQRGADLFVDALVRLGATDAFNIVGTGMYPLGDAFYRRRDEIRYISHLNESNLTLVAQGYARATRKPACAILYYSSGTALGMVGMTTAWADHVPLVVVSTTSSRITSGRDQYAAVPGSILEMTSQYTKWSFEVPTADRLPEALARAFAIAALPPMGPVHLAVPLDLWDTLVTDAPQCADFERTHTYVRTLADAVGLTDAAEMLAHAERPVLLFGSEVGQYTGAMAEAVRLAEALGAPVMADNLAAFLPFPTSHPSYIGKLKANRDAIESADVALSVGVEFTQLGVPEPPLLPPGLKLISLSCDPQLPVKQLWPDLALSGHPQASLAQLATLVAERTSLTSLTRNQNVTEKLRDRRLKRAQAVRDIPWSGPSLLRSTVLDVVNRYCAGEWTVLEALSSAVAHFDALVDLNDPDAYYGLSGKGSAQGWGAPSAIGVQLARPGARVIALLGDGNFMFTSSAVYLAGRLHLPMIFVVVNNSGWAHSRGTGPGRGGIQSGSPHPYPDDALASMGWLFDDAPIDYGALARSLGLRTSRASSADELTAALREAGDAREPWLIDVITEGDDPK
jgi:thiamine pyrophosphate-dependent acetolactate synthase large subunit-like protein